MTLQNIPSKVWTVHENTEQNVDLIPENSQFWLEAVPAEGSAAYYRMRFDDSSTINPSLRGMNFHPVGIEDLPAQHLPVWSEDERKTFRQAALDVRTAARASYFITRLEGSFVMPQIGSIPSQPLVARFYYFAGAEENGHDWMVLDILADPNIEKLAKKLPKDGHPHTLEDGTAHGDN
jgi:hypothetical protein